MLDIGQQRLRGDRAQSSGPLSTKEAVSRTRIVAGIAFLSSRVFLCITAYSKEVMPKLRLQCADGVRRRDLKIPN